MKNSTRIISNTVILYVKMAITVFVSLYSIRLVLSSLGTEDYGIFNVIMGVITMLSFLNTAMSVSSQRYLSFYQGKNDMKKMSIVYNLSLILHLLLGISICLFLSLLAKYIVYNFLSIPSERQFVSLIVFYCMSVSVFFTILSVPFTALINSNERMIYIAIVTVIESLLKLGIAISLQYVRGDKLLFYGIAMGALSFISLIEYYTICKIKFKESRIIPLKKLDWNIGKQMMRFIGWNLVGSITAISKNQGIAVLLNIKRGPAVNAAYGIANQVSGQLNFFSATLLRAINPQIIKKEGAGNHDDMIKMSLLTCKYSFLLLAFFSIPCIFQIETILSLWLKDTPQYTAVFCSFVLVAIMLDQLTVGINSAFQAANFVKQSAIFVGLVKLMIIPVGFLLLSLGYSVYTVVVGYALVELLGGIVRLGLANKYFNLSFKIYFQYVLAKLAIPTICSIIICVICKMNIENEIVQLLMTITLSAVIFIAASYLFSLIDKEKEIVRNLLVKVIKH